MNILESIVYGLISGLSEFLPISSLGHQQLLKIFFGSTDPQPLRDIFVHLSFLFAVWVGCGTYIEKLRRELQQNTKTKNRRSHQRDRKNFYDVALMKSASFLMIFGMILLRMIFRTQQSLSGIGFLFLLNGIFIFIPEYMPQGNKDSRKMSAFDSFLLGMGSALAVLPGFSRVGLALSAAAARGADKVKAYSWILVLTIPAVILMLVFDLILIFQAGLGVVTFAAMIGYILSGVFSFASSLAAVYLMRFLLVRSSISAFAYYSWGAALLSFLLYLSV